MPEGRMSLRDFLNQDVSELFSRRPGENSVSDSATAPQARLDITRSAAKLEFLCTGPRMRFFSLDARLAGALSVSRSQGRGQEPPRLSESVQDTRIEIPVEAGGKRHDIVLLYRSDEGDQPWPLAEADESDGADGSRALRFVFGNDQDRIQYRFVLPPDLAVQDFQPVQRVTRSVYTPPTPAQLGAVLRTTLNDRRDPVSALEDLGTALSPATVRLVAWLRGHLPARSSIQSPAVALLVEHFESLATRVPNSQLLASLVLLLDLEAGLIDEPRLEAFVRGGALLPTSFPALAAVARFYGAPLDATDFQARVERVGAPFVAGGSGSEKTMAAAMEALARRLSSPRDARQILHNLVRESPSPRVETLAESWSARPAAAPAPPEGLRALSDLLTVHARRMDDSTLTAFCLYAEIESSNLDEPRFLAWIEGRAPLTLSPYTIQAIAWARDVPLIGFSSTESQHLTSGFYGALFNLSPEGVIQSLRSEDDPILGTTKTYRFLRTPDDARQDLEGWRPTGDVMLRTPMLERQSERDLELFLRLGNSFYACFQSDLDRRRVWRLLRPEMLHTTSPFSFIEGFRVYHVQGSVLAELRPSAEAERAHGVSPLVCKDHRASIHFFHPADPPPAGGVMQAADLIVHFPLTAQLPRIMSETPPEKLLGRVETGASDVRKLELLRLGLRAVISTREESGPPLSHDTLQLLRQKLATPRVQQMLRQVVDQRTLEFIVAEFMNFGAKALEYRALQPLHKGLQNEDLRELAALALVHELCVSELTASHGFHKTYNAYLFRSMLRNQLLHILDSEDATARAVGCRVLSTAPCISDAAERAVIEYELLRRLEDRDDLVAQEAATALARVALEDDLPLPPIWTLRKVEAAAAVTNESDRAQQLLNVAQEIRGWQTRLSSMMVGAATGGQSAPAPARPGVASSPAGGLKELAALVLGVRLALAGQKVSRGTGLLLVTTSATLHEMLHGLLDTFNRHADSGGRSRRDLVAEVRGQGLGPLVTFLAQDGTGQRRRLEDDDHELESFSFDSACTPAPIWIQRESPEGTRVSPFFMGVVRKAMEGAIDKIRIGLLPDLPGETSRLLPPPFRLLVYDARTGQFAPFVQSMAALCPAEDQELLEAVAQALQTVDEAEPMVAPSHEGGEPPAQDEVAAEPPPPRPIVIEQERPEVLKRGRGMLEAFALPQTYLPQTLYVFQETRASSVYEFF